MPALTVMPLSMMKAAKPPLSKVKSPMPKARNSPMKEIGIIKMMARGKRRELKWTAQMTKINAMTSRISPAYFSLLE